MSEPSSLYARLTFDPDAFESFLRSAPARPAAFGDWQAWFDRHAMAGGNRVPESILADLDAERVSQVLDGWRQDARAGMPPVDYDAATGVCRIAMLQASENFHEMLRLLAPLRGASAWNRPDADDFIVILDFLWGGGETVSAYVSLRDGESRMPDDVPDAHRDEAIRCLEGVLAGFEQQD